MERSENGMAAPGRKRKSESVDFEQSDVRFTPGSRRYARIGKRGR